MALLVALRERSGGKQSAGNNCADTDNTRDEFATSEKLLCRNNAANQNHGGEVHDAERQHHQHQAPAAPGAVSAVMKAESKPAARTAIEVTRQEMKWIPAVSQTGKFPRCKLPCTTHNERDAARKRN